MISDYFARRLVTELQLAATARSESKRSVHLRACYLLWCLSGLRVERPAMKLRRARCLPRPDAIP